MEIKGMEVMTRLESVVFNANAAVVLRILFREIVRAYEASVDVHLSGENIERAKEWHRYLSVASGITPEI